MSSYAPQLPVIARPAFRLGAGLLSILFLACAGGGERQTLAGLRDRKPDLEETQIDHGIEQAMEGYRKFLEEAPKSSLTPEAMRRLADLELEKEYGSLEAPTAQLANAQSPASPDLASPESATLAAIGERNRASTGADRELAETESAFEARTLGSSASAYSPETEDLDHPAGAASKAKGPLQAIALYDQILDTYPHYPHNDRVLYQKTRALDELGRVDEAIEVSARLVADFPDSRHIDEVQFRRGEYYFTRKKFITAEEAYGAIISRGKVSDFHELALYKLGWTFYKQMLLDEALEAYIQLLDHKVSIGYDFDQTEDEADAQRIIDTYRVTSLCFSDLGGPEKVTQFFEAHGQRSYEDSVYRQLGEFYLEKLRYNDAARAYESFVELYPVHRVAPHFSMRVVEIYEKGDFPRLVLEAKKNFAVEYALRSGYWQHFDIEAETEVRDYLKLNLRDLANHYHALYQSTEQAEERSTHFEQSAHWYREFLSSFPQVPEAAAIHYQLADLLLENEDFGAAAREYERIAYDYPVHDQSAAAGYAAVFAHRKHLAGAGEADSEKVEREIVASSIRFTDTFPKHEQAAPVLAAAIDTLYGLKDYAETISNGHRLIENYPDSSIEIRRGAWTAIAHAFFDSDAFESAEHAYTQVLELTPDQHETTTQITENLAATIYKQGEASAVVEDHAAAADHFLRIAEVAPASEIRPLAEYDAASAFIRLENWDRASEVLENFRTTHPDHELNRQATQQIAYVYREAGDPSRAAEEYERVAAEAEDPQLRRESLLVAGELHEEAGAWERALQAYQEYVTNFTHPIEPAVVTRFKMAELHQKMGDESGRRSQLERIVAIDAAAGDERTPSVRTLGARSALQLSEESFEEFAEIELTQPFDASLRRKRQKMESALKTFEGLIDYGVGEVTAAATFYMAEIYAEFSRALLESERPRDLEGAALMDYNDVLEEEAFPFEEKSIAVHQKNLELISNGVFNDWVEKSLARLATVMPGRYAKREISTGPLEAIDNYAYLAPVPAQAVPAPEPVPDAEDAWAEREDPAEESPAEEFEAASAESVEVSQPPAALVSPWLDSRPEAETAEKDDAADSSTNEVNGGNDEIFDAP